MMVEMEEIMTEEETMQEVKPQGDLKEILSGNLGGGYCGGDYEEEIMAKIMAEKEETATKIVDEEDNWRKP